MLIGKSMEYYAAGSNKMASFNGVLNEQTGLLNKIVMFCYF